MLFERRFHAGLRDGSIDLSFRAWSRPQVKVGGRYRSQVGMLEVDAIQRVRVSSISDADARRAGFEQANALVEYLERTARAHLPRDAEVYRVALHHAGALAAGPPAHQAELSPELVTELSASLAKMDRLSQHGRWTARTLELIELRPRVAASRLAGEASRETRAFKADVRKLKRLGLTLSFDMGYEISPRGRAFLAARASAGDTPSGTAGES